MLRLLILMQLLACSGADDKGATGDDTDTQTEETGSHETGSHETGGQDTDTHTGASDACNTSNEECEPRASGCGGEGANMLPGSNCLACHVSGGDREAPIWSAGGTLFSDIDGTSGASGATVRITDSTGTTVELTTSTKGNFYTSQRLTPPLTAEVETSAGVKAMASSVDTGACNSCHSCEGAAGGKMFAP